MRARHKPAEPHQPQGHIDPDEPEGSPPEEPSLLGPQVEGASQGGGQFHSVIRIENEPPGVELLHEVVQICPKLLWLRVILLTQPIDDLVLNGSFAQQIPDPRANLVEAEVHARVEVEQDGVIVDLGYDE
jgi:hypothetical protein